MEKKVGLVGTAAPTGIGNRNRWLWNNLPFLSWHVTPHNLFGITEQANSIEYSNDVDWADDFLKTIDILVCEGFPNPSDLFEKAKARGIRTVLLSNPDTILKTNEWLPFTDTIIVRTIKGMLEVNDETSHPDVRYCPTPIDLKEFPFTKRTTARHFGHICGLGGLLNRKSVDVIQKIPEIKIHNQRLINGEYHHLETPDMLYKDFDVIVQPSKWANVDNAILEAMASGCVVMTTDLEPMSHYLKESFAFDWQYLKPESIEFVEIFGKKKQIAFPSLENIQESINSIKDRVDLQTSSVNARNYVERTHGESAFKKIWEIIHE